MMKTTLKLGLAITLGALFSTAASAADEPTGNRYGYPRFYKSEISAAKAYLLAKARKGVIIDVRRVEEYVAGHPEGAYSIPFPHVTGTPGEPNDSTDYIGYDISVDPDVGFLVTDGKDGTLPVDDFVKYVESVLPKKDTPIFVLCATGHRSVQASNALAKYGAYTNVRNIWEGYNGQPKYAYTGSAPTIPLAALDLNNDNVVDGNDRDGWAYFQELPVTTKIKPKLISKTYKELYLPK